MFILQYYASARRASLRLRVDAQTSKPADSEHFVKPFSKTPQRSAAHVKTVPPQLTGPKSVNNQTHCRGVNRTVNHVNQTTHTRGFANAYRQIKNSFGNLYHPFQ